MAQNEFNERVIREFRGNGGKVGAPFANAPMILVTHTGAKSGKSYTTPLVYSRDGGERIIVIASKAGAPNNPAWYHNLLANPVATLEIGVQKFQAKARVATGAERDRLFNQQAEQMPIFNEYRGKTTRQIPVIIFEPA